MASTAGSIVLGIFADVAQLKTDLQRANANIEDFSGKATRSLSSLTKMAGGFASAFAGIGLAFSGTALAAFAKQAVEAADNIGDLAEQTGLSASSLQALQYAARDVGADAGALTSGIAKLNKELGEAGMGSKEAVENFQKLGISFKDNQGYMRTTEDVVRQLADRMAAAKTTAEATAIATGVLGKGAAPLVPLFRQGAGAIDELVAKLREMGVLIDDHSLAQADELSKSFAKMSSTIQTSLTKAVLAFSPMLITLAEAFATAAVAAGQFFDRLGQRIDRIQTEWKPFIDFVKFVWSLPATISEKTQALMGPSSLEVTPPMSPEGLRALQELSRTTQSAFTPLARATPVSDPAAAKKASDERVKANFAAAQAELKFYEEIGELENKYRLAQDAARDAEVVGDREAYLLREKEAADFRAEIDRYSAEYHAKEQARREDEITRDRDAYLEQVKQKADFQAEIDRITADYYRDEQARLDADLAKRGAMFDKLFEPFTRAFETSVTGIIQGTTTLEAAFQKMGQSIAVSLGETAVKEGVDLLKKALKELMQNEMVQKLIKTGIGAVGSMFSPTVNVAPVQNIDVNAMPMAAGGIVQSPTFAVVGEAGPEAVVPLDRWGEMGGGVTINIIDQRREGNVQTQEKTTASGERQVDVLITDVVRAGLAGGSYDRALGGSFGLSRRGVQR